MKKKIYITGVSGTGKSTLGLELKSRGCSVTDIDDEDFCGWYDKDGNRFTGDTRSGDSWLEDHFWQCDIPRLEKAIEQSINDDVFIVGISSNLDNYPFDKIFLLAIEPKVLVKRLTERTTNDFGKESFEQEFVLENKDEYENKMLVKGAVVLDATKSTIDLSAEVLKQFASNP